MKRIFILGFKLNLGNDISIMRADMTRKQLQSLDKVLVKNREMEEKDLKKNQMTRQLFDTSCMRVDTQCIFHAIIFALGIHVCEILLILIHVQKSLMIFYRTKVSLSSHA